MFARLGDDRSVGILTRLKLKKDCQAPVAGGVKRWQEPD